MVMPLLRLRKLEFDSRIISMKQPIKDLSFGIGLIYKIDELVPAFGLQMEHS